MGMQKRPAQVVRIAEDLEAWSPAYHTFDSEDLPYIVEAEIVIDGATAVCNALSIERREGGPPVNGTGLRKLPLGRLLKYAEGDPTFVMEHTAPHTWTPVPGASSDRASEVLRGPKTSRSLGPEQLRAVASLVRDAKYGQSTMRAVAAAMKVTDGYARRLIQRAR